MKQIQLIQDGILTLTPVNTSKTMKLSCMHRHLFGFDIPKDFEFDGVSFFVKSNNACRVAALLHDYLYRTTSVNITRAHADKLFRLALVEFGVSKTKAYTMWSGVRAGGWKSFKKRDEKKK